MHRAISIAWVVFFIVSITAKDMTSLGWEIWYVSNKSYVARELCENKAKPAMNCNGQCYLAKQLRKAEQEQQDAKKSAPVRTLKLKSLDWIAVTAILEVREDGAASALSATLHGPEITAPTFTFANAVFHPPTV